MRTELHPYPPAGARARYAMSAREAWEIRAPATGARADGWDWFLISVWLGVILLSIATWSGLALLLMWGAG